MMQMLMNIVVLCCVVVSVHGNIDQDFIWKGFCVFTCQIDSVVTKAGSNINTVPGTLHSTLNL